ncbi:MAG: tyrosine-type recombinase/integrase, partial [Candidatus Thermoplasmatota archaeon]
TLSPLEEGALPLPPERNAAFVYLARLASGSRRTMREALDEIAQFVWGKRADAARVPWHTLRYAHTSAVRAYLAEKNAPATTNKKLAALRSVLKEAWKLGLLPTDEYHKAVEIDGVKGDHLPVGRALAKDQVAALYTTCAKDSTFWGRRDAALLALLQGVALRRAEACAMTLADYDPQTGQVVIRRGKGGKQRAIWLPPPGRAAIEEWIAVRGREPGFLLAAISPTGRPRPERAMSTETVYARLQVLAGRADVPRFSPHDLRRTYATDAIADGEDLVTVKRLMGHESIETTVRYDRRGEAVLREAAVKRYLPFHPTAAALPSNEATPPEVPAEKAAAPSVDAAMPPKLAEKSAPPRTSTTKSAKRPPPVQKKAPRIAAGAPSPARTIRRPRRTPPARPATWAPLPGKR